MTIASQLQAVFDHAGRPHVDLKELAHFGCQRRTVGVSRPDVRPLESEHPGKGCELDARLGAGVADHHRLGVGTRQVASRDGGCRTGAHARDRCGIHDSERRAGGGVCEVDDDLDVGQTMAFAIAEEAAVHFEREIAPDAPGLDVKLAVCRVHVRERRREDAAFGVRAKRAFDGGDATLKWEQLFDGVTVDNDYLGRGHHR